MKHWICVLALLGTVSGCMGESKENKNNPQGDEEAFFAENVRSRVTDLQFALEKGEGNKINAVKQTFASYQESPIDLDNGAVGDNKATYEAIVKGLNDVETMLQGTPSVDDLKKKLAELKSLTDKLPKMQGTGAPAG